MSLNYSKALASVIHTFEHLLLQDQSDDFSKNLSVAFLGWEKGCIRLWDRSDENYGFYGNRKPPLTCNGKNDVSTFSRLFFFLYIYDPFDIGS